MLHYNKCFAVRFSAVCFGSCIADRWILCPQCRRTWNEELIYLQLWGLSCFTAFQGEDCLIYGKIMHPGGSSSREQDEIPTLSLEVFNKHMEVVLGVVV